MPNSLTSDPTFGFTLCIISYYIGIRAKRKFDYPVVNPLIIATLICIGVILCLKIPLENFMNGASIISLFLAPATSSLALTMYRKSSVIKKNILPVLVGCITGSTVAVTSVLILCKLLKLPGQITASLIPKSVTTAIATEVSRELGGMPPVTVAAVLVTGVFGTILSPYLLKWSRINNPIATGLAIGASCHALGTTRAIEMGETEGSLSGIAVAFCGIITVFISIFL